MSTLGIHGGKGTATDPSSVSIVAANAVVSTANSSTTPLGISGVFTGTAELTDAYSTITIFAFSDKASATNGLSLQFSQDATNWDFLSATSVAANDGVTLVLAPVGRYFRVIYTNGGTAQTTFRLQTKFHSVALSPIILPLSTALTADIPTSVSHAVIAGRSTAGGGSFIDVKVNPSGTLQVGGTIDAVTSITNSVTVAGTVTANAGTNLNTSALSLEATQLLLMARADTFKTRSDTFTSTTSGTTVDVSASPMSMFGIQVTMTGSVTSWDVRLEASLNNVAFTTILTHTNVTGDGVVLWTGNLLAPALYFRARCAGLVLGAGTNVVAVILGKN
jgi:hypothetical protein